ncbi:MAG: hypothetical protein ACD_60C00006G0003 [uncultured bacterium]|nr:MAG: hypothetical protein ACD_60C00006G0003 [uncultured bacterium]
MRRDDLEDSAMMRQSQKNPQGQKKDSRFLRLKRISTREKKSRYDAKRAQKIVWVAPDGNIIKNGPPYPPGSKEMLFSHAHQLTPVSFFLNKKTGEPTKVANVKNLNGSDKNNHREVKTVKRWRFDKLRVQWLKSFIFYTLDPSNNEPIELTGPSANENGVKIKRGEFHKLWKKWNRVKGKVFYVFNPKTGEPRLTEEPADLDENGCNAEGLKVYMRTQVVYDTLHEEWYAQQKFSHEIATLSGENSSESQESKNLDNMSDDSDNDDDQNNPAVKSPANSNDLWSIQSQTSQSSQTAGVYSTSTNEELVNNLAATPVDTLFPMPLISGGGTSTFFTRPPTPPSSFFTPIPPLFAELIESLENQGQSFSWKKP